MTAVDVKVDVKRLMALAEVATPGPWHWRKNARGTTRLYLEDAQNNTVIGSNEYAGSSWIEGDKEADFDFIAACDPKTILSFCKRVEALETGLGDIQRYYEREFVEGEKAYQAVIIARALLKQE